MASFHSDILFNIWDEHRWFRFPIDFLSEMTSNEGILLAALLNLITMRVKKNQDVNGWVKMKTSYLQKALNGHWSTTKIDKLIQNLKKKKYIRIRIKGSPPDRWLKINARRVLRAMNFNTSKMGESIPPKWENTSKMGESIPPKWENQYLQNGRISTRISLLRRDDARTKKKEKNNKTRTPEVRANWTDFGLLLKETILQNRNLPKTSNPRKWGEHFKRIHETDGFPVELIRSTLEWYCQQLKKEGDIVKNDNPNFLPVAYSGKAFRSKFERILQARERLEIAQEKRLQSERGPVNVSVVDLDDPENEA